VLHQFNVLWGYHVWALSVNSEHTTPVKEGSHADLRYLSLKSLARADSMSTKTLFDQLFPWYRVIWC